MTDWKTEEKRWGGVKPTECQICGEALTEGWIDGRTKEGPWGNMCPKCHAIHGVGIGLGKGQRYSQEGVKLEG